MFMGVVPICTEIPELMLGMLIETEPGIAGFMFIATGTDWPDTNGPTVGILGTPDAEACIPPVGMTGAPRPWLTAQSKAATGLKTTLKQLFSYFERSFKCISAALRDG
jgi:hypothetical protein